MILAPDGNPVSAYQAAAAAAAAMMWFSDIYPEPLVMTTCTGNLCSADSEFEDLRHQHALGDYSRLYTANRTRHGLFES